MKALVLLEEPTQLAAAIRLLEPDVRQGDKRQIRRVLVTTGIRGRFRRQVISLLARRLTSFAGGAF